MDLSRKLSKEDMQMANKHTRSLNIITVREMSTQPAMRDHFTPLGDC